MPEAWNAILWWEATLLLAGAAFAWSRWLFHGDSPLSIIGHTTVLSWAAVVLVSFLLGSLGFLTGYLLIVSVSGVALTRLRFAVVEAKGFLEPIRASRHGSRIESPACWNAVGWPSGASCSRSLSLTSCATGC